MYMDEEKKKCIGRSYTKMLTVFLQTLMSDLFDIGTVFLIPFFVYFSICSQFSRMKHNACITRNTKATCIFCDGDSSEVMREGGLLSPGSGSEHNKQGSQQALQQIGLQNGPGEQWAQQVKSHWVSMSRLIPGGLTPSCRLSYPGPQKLCFAYSLEEKLWPT